jgi:hypothetical protein
MGRPATGDGRGRAGQRVPEGEERGQAMPRRADAGRLEPGRMGGANPIPGVTQRGGIDWPTDPGTKKPRSH